MGNQAQHGVESLAMLLALITMIAAAEPGSCTGATGVRITFTDHARGTALFDRVKVGWSAKRLRAHLGAPERCEGDVWFYSAGHSDGPLANASFTVKKGVVTAIDRSGAGCILNE